METEKIKIGITHGDINGIGYEIIIKTLQDKRICDLCVPIVYGSPKLTAYHRKALNMESFNLNIIDVPGDANPKRPNVLSCIDENVRIELGKLTEEAGKAAMQSIEAATKDLLEGEIDAVLTAPINKNSIQSAGFEFPGHTEYFQNKTESPDSLMFMLGDTMKIGVVTGHIPLKYVAQTISEELILSKLRLMQSSLLQDFAIRKPKIAVLGLNPHAGDEGVLGKEEQEVIIPTLEKARAEGIMALGPYAADGFFGAQMFLKFDAVLAMYHDQGLAAFKAVEFESGVNFTAGLPIVRTSPNHGTAFEIAGKGIAAENSFRSALFRAIEIVKNRKQYEEISKDPL